MTTGKELALEQQPDQLLLVLYLSKFYEAFRRLPGGHGGEALCSCFLVPLEVFLETWLTWLWLWNSVSGI